MKNTRLILLHALTPLHVGTGQAVGTVDLPIAREKATGFPLVPASAFKGVLRDEYRAHNDEEKEKRTFGDTDQAGEWVFTDLRLLCLPVRSFFGVFAYVTCPLILSRLQQHAQVFDIAGFEDIQVAVDGTQAALTQNSELHKNGKVYLEDLDLSAVPSPQVDRAAQAIAQKLLSPNEQSLFTERFAVVSNDVFNFLSETATEVVARVRLQDDTKTVVQGGLWYEEAVPAEAIFYGFVGTTNSKTSLDELDLKEPLQIGGDATIGRGLCKVVMTR
ncbi:MAG: type III-B CRISPR module RAMP protein Cmr4 [Fimbriimonadales bacterium]